MTHSIDWPVRQLSRTGSSSGDWFQISAWQFMQVFVGGTLAKAAFSTDVWQYRQSSPMAPTWCWWENWTGWTRATPCWVV